MTRTAVHPCPRCPLRFNVLAELEDHLARDHGASPSTVQSPVWGQICVAVDPVRGDSPSVRIAAVVAAQAGMAVEVVAVPPAGLGQQATEAFLASRVKRADRAGSPASSWRCLDEDDAIADALLAHVAEGDTTMVCMDSRSRGPVAEMTLGSVSEAVVRRAPVPVMLLGPAATPRPEGYRTLLVGLDGSALAEAALHAAAALAGRLHADLFLVQVVDPDDPPPEDVVETNYLRHVAGRLPASRTSYDVLHEKDPARALVELAERTPDALVVVGTHGRTGMRRLTMGSVALDVVRHAPSPVLVVSDVTSAEDRAAAS